MATLNMFHILPEVAEKRAASVTKSRVFLARKRKERATPAFRLDFKS
jgi:hypothetical protein